MATKRKAQCGRWCDCHKGAGSLEHDDRRPGWQDVAEWQDSCGDNEEGAMVCMNHGEASQAEGAQGESEELYVCWKLDLLGKGRGSRMKWGMRNLGGADVEVIYI
jgi:hypothetical protein